jgi:formimidoylglutamate deiminase
VSARVELREGGLHLPGIASAHSHAFQRALRGRTQRPSTAAGSFWSWRGLMYELASRLDPDTLYDLSHFAFVELALAGVTAVGEFHYVHHDPGGAPFADRTLLADTVVRAALDAGLRITLLRVVYERAGRGRPPEGAQRRFCDARIDDALADVETLRARHAGSPRVRIGIAPHSVRAVTRASLSASIDFARANAMPLHAHVSEQRREIRECLAEHGRRPVELLADLGALDPLFSAVHATHLTPREAALLGAARAFACVCRTTERDLGDGAPDVGALVRAGARLTIGADSHASSCPFEEARAIELDERTRQEARHVGADALALVRALTEDGYASLGWSLGDCDDSVVLDAGDPALVGARAPLLEDAVVFGASGRAVRDVTVAGAPVVRAGRHVSYDAARARFERALARLD